ncbi:MAG: hypothetical protein JXB17_08220 [Bacteroidales bacterium]|nr:hypothetical protein [Bacteroidales bacterium]
MYANATLHFDTYLKLKDSLGLIYPTWKEIEDRNVNIDESVTNSYVFQKIKLEFDSLTYNLSLDQINEVIDNYTISSQGLKYAKIAELSFQENLYKQLKQLVML